MAVNAATLGALAMIAHQVGIKATRDTLFLSSLGVEALPAMIAAAAVFSILSVLVASRLVATYGPRRVVPATFLVSAILLLGEWLLWYQTAPVGSVVVYLHVAALGSFVISGFWSMINERFDPRTGKAKIGAIARGATVGGLLGGIIAERVAAFGSSVTMLPILSVMHVGCALALYFVGRAPSRKTRTDSPESGGESGMRYIARVPYLRNIAVLVALTACSGTLLDYVFKSRAVASYGQGEDLMRFFAIFYTVVGVATLISQSFLTRPVLEKFGLSQSIGVLPLVTGFGSVATLLVPGLGVAGVARGGESAARSSVFRSGYELLYMPISNRQKRAAKPIIDVAFDRLGDVMGAALIASLLVLSQTRTVTLILLSGALLAGGAYYLSSRLQSYYVDTLKRNLVNRAEELDLGQVSNGSAPATVLGTLRSLDLGRVVRSVEGLPRRAEATPDAAIASKTSTFVTELDSQDLDRVKAALATAEMNPVVAARTIDLLAWDEACGAAIEALRKSAPKIVGQLTDALTDQNRAFSLRRRIPRVLSETDSQVAIEGLMAGLKDRRFEVRYHSAVALSRIRGRIDDIGVETSRLESAILNELEVDPRRWQARRLIDSDNAIEAEEQLNKKLDLSLEHIFRLLSLFLDRDPIKIALEGLYTEDEQLRGTALEYLESVLPPTIRPGLWPLLEDRRPTRRARTENEALSNLLMSRPAIERHHKKS